MSKLRSSPQSITFKFEYGELNSALYTLFTQEMLSRGYVASNSIYLSNSHTEKDMLEYFDAVDQFGTVAVGRRADLILLEANPADDIGRIRNRVGVMVNGRWIPAAEIERRLREIALFYGNEP